MWSRIVAAVVLAALGCACWWFAVAVPASQAPQPTASSATPSGDSCGWYDAYGSEVTPSGVTAYVTLPDGTVEAFYCADGLLYDPAAHRTYPDQDISSS